MVYDAVCLQAHSFLILRLGGKALINIGSLKNISRVKKCSRGSIITGEGLVNMMFIILKGEVGVYSSYRLPGAEMIRTLGAGEFFADAGLLQDKKAAYTTVSLSDAIILPVERHSFQAFLQDEPALAFEMVRDLYLRLESNGTLNKETSDHHTDDTHYGATNAEAKQTEATITDAAQPSDSVTTGSVSGGFRLFPEGHGHYDLLLNNNDTVLLMHKSHTCPICKKDFPSLAVRNSKLVLASTDNDMRSRYKGIEPLYYEVLTCPHCLYSALPDLFNAPDKSKPEMARELESIKNAVTFRGGMDRDAESVFTGYYLALFCAPFCFSKHQLVTGKLLYKLSRVYQDTGDTAMEYQTAQKALENYLYAYENIGIPAAQEQQICILIGELFLKLGDMKNAINFFFKAKTSASSTPALKNHADNRVYDIREMAAACR
jgi:uncharacterized protein (DUF2225 family)